MMTRQERALRNAVIILAAATLVCGGLLIWSLRAMAVLGGDEADPEQPDVAAAGGQPVTDRQWVEELKKKHGEEVLLGMINRIVVEKEAAALGIKATAADVEQELESSIAGYGSEEQYYAQMASELGLSREEVRTETEYRLTLQAIATHGITIGEREVDQYLQEHAERFQPKKELQLSLIKLDSPEAVDRAMDRLEQGEDFAALAKEVSIDEESGPRGGSLGTVEEDDPFWPQEVLKAASELNSGDIAGPIEAEDSFYIVRLENVTVPAAASPAEIRNQVRRELALEQAAPLQQIESDLRTKYHASINIDKSLRD